MFGMNVTQREVSELRDQEARVPNMGNSLVYVCCSVPRLCEQDRS
jgi:hypothetical protein